MKPSEFWYRKSSRRLSEQIENYRIQKLKLSIRKNEVFFVIRKFHENVLGSNRGKFKVNAPVLYFKFHISMCMHYTDKVEVRFIAPNFRKQY